MIRLPAALCSRKSNSNSNYLAKPNSKKIRWLIRGPGGLFDEKKIEAKNLALLSLD
jgi:hypothetical protein